jgi:putative ABC transport system substrate-binding protein
MKIVRAPRSAVCKNLFCFALSSLSFVFCLSAQAQQPKMISLGFLGATSAAIEKDRIDVFMEGMRELGYVENKNIVIKWRFAEGKFTRLPELANDWCA